MTAEPHFIDIDGVRWLRSADVAMALGYARPGGADRLFERHCDRYPPGLARQGEDGRLFSLRGAYLLSLLAKTSHAPQFRRWALAQIGCGRDGSEPIETAPPNPHVDGLWLEKMTYNLRLAVGAADRIGAPLATAEVWAWVAAHLPAADLTCKQHMSVLCDLTDAPHEERMRLMQATFERAA